MITEKNHLIRRICARVVDYTLFYSLISVICPFLGVWVEFSQEILLAFFTPMIFFPIEALSLYYFQTTIGRGLFELSVRTQKDTMPTYIECARHSFYQALKINSVIGIFLESILAKLVVKQKILPTLKTIITPRKTSSFFLYLSSALLCTAAPQVYLQVYCPPLSLTIQNKEGDFSAWKAFSIPNLGSKVSFPGTPETKEKSLKLPKGAKPLKYTEFAYTDPVSSGSFSVGHTKLPKSILKWSSSLVLKGSLDIIKDNEKGAKLIKKEICKIGKIPCLNYTMEKGGKIFTGRLLLVEDTLYKIDSTHVEENAIALHNSIQYFLDSFES